MIRSRAKRFLEAAARRGEKFDLVVVDPPALVPTREMLRRGIRTYLAVNAAALSLVEEGGLLFTSSCSQFVGAERFRGVLVRALERVGRRGLFLGGVRGQSPDHPIDPLHPWTGYLKGFLLTVS